MIQSDDGGDPFRSARGDRRDGFTPQAQAAVEHQQPLIDHREPEPEPEPAKATTYYQPHEDAVDGGADQPVRLFTDDDPVYENKCSRVAIFILAIVLMAAGIGLAVLGRIEVDHKVLPFCPKCGKFATALYIAGSSIAVFGLLGFAAAFTRAKPLAFGYAFLLFLLALLAFACGTAIVVFELGLSDKEIEKMWTEAIDEESDLVCNLQERLSCSGLNKCCGLRNATASPSPWNTVCNITHAEYLIQCDASCTDSNQRFTEPCHDKVKDLVQSHFKPLIGVAFAVFVILSASVVFSVRMALSTVPKRRSLHP